MKTILKPTLLQVITIIIFLTPAGVRAGSEINTGYFGGVAIEGYDTVAYFTDKQAVKGSDKFQYDWLGATWYFKNSGHRDLFSENPVKYAPQYGGFCADGVAYGETTVNIEPTSFAIIDGKLYISAAKEMELDKVDGQLAKAENNWPKIRAELISE